MMMASEVSPRPRKGPGRFQWDKGGWFGAQVGSTCWLLIAASVLAPQNGTAGAVALLCFLVPNAFGVMLYRKRATLLPHSAIQALLAVIGLFTTGFIFYINKADVVHLLDDRLGMGRWGFYCVPFLFIGMMFLFSVQERRAGPGRPAS